MGRYSTYPLVLEDSLELCISFLKSRGYIKPDHNQGGTITWSRGDVKRGAIHVWINTDQETGVAVLEYDYKKEPKSQRIQLVSVPSNLGVGRVWYFVCPHTGERARKLYCFSNGKFLSRVAYKEVYYESQLRSKFYRKLDNTLGRSFKAEKYYAEMYSKGFTKYYKGKKTRRHKKLLSKIAKADTYSLRAQIDFEELLGYR